MKKFTLILLAVTLAVAGAMAQTTKLTADGKVTTTKTGSTWNLVVDGRTIATGLSAMPTVGTSGNIFYTQKGGKTIPVDRTGKVVVAQRITKEQIYDETIERLNKDGITVAEGAAFEAAEAKRIAAIRAEEARDDARMKEIDLRFNKGVNEDVMQVYVKGKLVFEGSGRVRTRAFSSDDIYDRYWFLWGKKEGGWGVLAIDTTTGDFTELLPFKYRLLEEHEFMDDHIVCMGGGSVEVYRYNGKTEMVFEKIRE